MLPFWFMTLYHRSLAVTPVAFRLITERNPITSKVLIFWILLSLFVAMGCRLKGASSCKARKTEWNNKKNKITRFTTARPDEIFKNVSRSPEALQTCMFAKNSPQFSDIFVRLLEHKFSTSKLRLRKENKTKQSLKTEKRSPLSSVSLFCLSLSRPL